LEINKKTLRNLFLVVAAGIVLYWLLHEPERADHIYAVITGAISPFVMGFAISFVLNVPMRAFEGVFKGIKNAGLRRTVALVLTFILLALIVTGVCLLLIPQLVQTIQTLIPRVMAFFVEVESSITKYLNDNPQIMQWIYDNTDLEKVDLASLVQNVVTMVGNSVSTILTKTLSAIGSVAGAAMDFVIACIFSIYCLFQKEQLARQGRKLVYAVLPEKVADYIIRVFRLSNSTFSNFLSGQCIEVCILGSLFAIFMTIFGMPYVPLISVTIAVMAFIPIVGAWIACGSGAFLILIEDPTLALGFILMFIVIQQFEGNLIYPRVVGTSIGLSGMWVLVAISIGGEIMGVGGMLVMIPAASVLYTLVSELINHRLKDTHIDPAKLQHQPPELRSRFKEKREKRKTKMFQKKKVEDTEQ